MEKVNLRLSYTELNWLSACLKSRSGKLKEIEELAHIEKQVQDVFLKNAKDGE